MNKISVINIYPIEITLVQGKVIFKNTLDCINYLFQTIHKRDRRLARKGISSFLKDNHHYNEWLEVSSKLTETQTEIFRKYKNDPENVSKNELDSCFEQIEAILPKEQVLYHCGELENKKSYLSTTLNLAYAFQKAICGDPIYIITIKSEDIKFYCYNDIDKDKPECEVLIYSKKIEDLSVQNNTEFSNDQLKISLIRCDL